MTAQQANGAFSISTSKATRQYLKVLLYAPPGTGKTYLAGTAQDVEAMQNVIFVDVEAGAMSLSHRDDIDIVRVHSYSQFSKVYDFLRMHCRYRDADDMENLTKLNQRFGADPEKEYHTVVIDSLTEVQKQLMYMLLGMDVGSANLEMIPQTPEFKEWGQSAEMIRLLIRAFRDLPMHVIVVCAEAEYEDERKRRVKRPNLPGKLAGEIQGFLDVVGYLATARGGENNELNRRLYVSPGNTFQAKNRFGTDVDYIDDPEMNDLWELANGGN